jgi:hypothetical protein
MLMNIASDFAKSRRVRQISARWSLKSQRPDDHESTGASEFPRTQYSVIIHAVLLMAT